VYTRIVATSAKPSVIRPAVLPVGRSLGDSLVVPRQPIPIRFDSATYELAAREAGQHGISTADFVRAATLVAAVLSAAIRGAAVEVNYAELMDLALELLR
jgi:hypothetical protein